jgi:VanZ family protein
MGTTERFVRYAVPLLAYAGMIYFLSAQSHLPTPRNVAGFSTGAHVFEYLGFGMLVARGLRGYGVAPLRAALFGVLVCMLYGGTDEYHQRYTPNRVPDIMDWVADSVGASLGCSIWFLRRRRS